MNVFCYIYLFLTVFPMKILHGQKQFFCSFLRIGDTIKNTDTDIVNRLIKIGMTFPLIKTWNWLFSRPFHNIKHMKKHIWGQWKQTTLKKVWILRWQVQFTFTVISYENGRRTRLFQYIAFSLPLSVWVTYMYYVSMEF